MGVTIGPLTLLVSDRDVPFDIYAGRIAPDNPKPGDTVEIHWEGYRHRDCPGTVERKIIDASGYIHTVLGVDAQYTQTANPQPVVRSFRLPLNMPPGQATYIATSRFRCNIIHRLWPITIERPHVTFMVAKGAAPAPGATGAQGPQGERGLQGERGPAGD